MFVMEKLLMMMRKRKMICWRMKRKRWKRKSHTFLMNSRHQSQSMSMDVILCLQGLCLNPRPTCQELVPSSHSQSVYSRCLSFQMIKKLCIWIMMYSYIVKCKPFDLVLSCWINNISVQEASVTNLHQRWVCESLILYVLILIKESSGINFSWLSTAWLLSMVELILKKEKKKESLWVKLKAFNILCWAA